MRYKITVCYKMEDLLYIYAYTDIQLRIDCRCLVVGFLYNSGGRLSGNLVGISINLCKSIQKELFINDTP